MLCSPRHHHVMFNTPFNSHLTSNIPTRMQHTSHLSSPANWRVNANDKLLPLMAKDTLILPYVGLVHIGAIAHLHP